MENNSNELERVGLKNWNWVGEGGEFWLKIKNKKKNLRTNLGRRWIWIGWETKENSGFISVHLCQRYTHDTTVSMIVTLTTFNTLVARNNGKKRNLFFSFCSYHQYKAHVRWVLTFDHISICFFCFFYGKNIQSFRLVKQTLSQA